MSDRRGRRASAPGGLRPDVARRPERVQLVSGRLREPLAVDPSGARRRLVLGGLDDADIRPLDPGRVERVERVVDPLAAFGSGALLAAVPPERIDGALDALDAAGIAGAEIGRVESAEGDGGTVRIDGEMLAEPPRDELYPLWE